MTTQNVAITTRPSVTARWRQVLAQPWSPFGRRVLLAGAALIALGWMLPVFHHPWWILALMSLFAVKFGRDMGGAEVIDGTQEFAWSLPIRRNRLLWTRLLAGVTVVGVLSGLSSLAIALSWPQAIWGLVVESGFAKPFGPWPASHAYAYKLAVICPVLAYVTAFGLSAAARSRPAVDMLSLLAGAAVAAAIGGGLAIEYWRWGWLDGRAVSALLAAMAVGSITLGAWAFLRKDAVHREGATWVKWWLVAVIVLLLLMVLMSFLWFAEPSDVVQHEYAIDPPEAATAPVSAHLRPTEGATVEGTEELEGASDAPDSAEPAEPAPAPDENNQPERQE
ncbi:MAG: hypothetical protein ACYS8X_13975 [Planctomycetota bacterium]|jgi:hypothetical protein